MILALAFTSMSAIHRLKIIGADERAKAKMSHWQDTLREKRGEKANQYEQILKIRVRLMEMIMRRSNHAKNTKALHRHEAIESINFKSSAHNASSRLEKWSILRPCHTKNREKNGSSAL